MQVRSRYKWVFILGFITILMIALAYLVSEKLIRKLDQESGSVGVMIHVASPNEITVWHEQSLDFIKQNPIKVI